MDMTPKNRYEDTNPNRRKNDGCLFGCDDHGEWKERLKILDNIPPIVTWMNSVKDVLIGLPDIIHWMDQEKGSKNTSRVIFGVLTTLFITGFISSALMFKSDMTTTLNAFKVESVERINLFKVDYAERQAAMKLEISERQKVYEENAKDQSSAYAVRINTIVDAVAEMKTQIGIITKLNEQVQRQESLDREETKAMMKELQRMVMENKADLDTKRK